MYERVKLFSVQRNIVNFHKDIYIQQIEKLAYHRSYYKILGKHHVAGVRHNAFESTAGDISNRSDYAKQFTLNPTVNYRNNYLATIVPYPWMVSV